LRALHVGASCTRPIKGVRLDAPTIETINLDELVKSRNFIEFVIPAKAGIQLFQDVLDPGFRRGDAPRDFLRDHQSLPTEKSSLR
jgi:hypothetical protein